MEQNKMSNDRGAGNESTKGLPSSSSDHDVKKSSGNVSGELTEEEMQEKIKTHIQRAGYIPSWMLSRTALCRHRLSCYENVINGFVGSFSYCLVGKIILSNLPILFNFAKLRKNLLSWNQNKDNIRIAVFVGLMNSMYKLVLCLMRRIYKSDKVASVVAGFVAGLCLSIDARKRRILIMILILSRVVDSSRMMATRKLGAPTVPHFEVAIWILCNVAQMYAMAYESDTLNRSMYNF